MSRKIIITVIAIVLVIGVIGGCYALYTKNASDVSVDITAGHQLLTLTITSTDVNASGNVEFAEDDAFSPTHRTNYVDVTLAASPSSLFDGIEGKFTVSVSDTENTLGAYLTTTVTLIDAVGGNAIAENSDITTAALGSGYNTALTATPKYARVSFYLSDAGVTNFATIAETTATISLSWAHDAASVWSVDESAYYLVGNFGGTLKWDIDETNVELNDTPTNDGFGYNTAQKNSVSLNNGDKIKVRKGDGTWYAPAAGDVHAGVTYTIDGDGNFVIGADGNYGIFLKGGVFYVKLNS